MPWRTFSVIVMLSFKSASISETVQPILWPAKALGIFPFSLNLSNPSSKNAVVDIFQIICTTAFWVLFFFYHLGTENFLQVSGSETATVGGKFCNLFGIVIVIVMTVGNFFNRNKFLRVAESMRVFDQKVRALIIITYE